MKYSRALLLLTLLASALLATACYQPRQPGKAPRWDANDPSCKVSGMQHICMRSCRRGEVGPDGAACVDRSISTGTVCDCGTR